MYFQAASSLLTRGRFKKLMAKKDDSDSPPAPAPTDPVICAGQQCDDVKLRSLAMVVIQKLQDDNKEYVAAKIRAAEWDGNPMPAKQGLVKSQEAPDSKAVQKFQSPPEPKDYEIKYMLQLQTHMRRASQSTVDEIALPYNAGHFIG